MATVAFGTASSSSYALSCLGDREDVTERAHTRRLEWISGLTRYSVLPGIIFKCELPDHVSRGTSVL